MAVDPQFASIVQLGAGLVPATADTSRTAPTNTTTIVTAGSNGTKIEELTFQGVGTTVAGVVCVFLYDGATYHLYDEVLVSAVTPSTIVAAYQLRKQYTNLLLKNGWTLRVTTQVAGNQSLVKVIAVGGDL